MTATALRQADHVGYSARADGASQQFEVLIDAQCPADWDETVARFDDVNYDQTAVFTNNGWGAARMSRLMLRRNGAVVAAARTAIITLPGVPKGIAFLRGGPLWRRHGAAVDLALYRAAVDAARAEYGERRGHHLVITPRFNPDYAPMEGDILKSEGFRVQRQSADPYRYFVRVDISEKEQMASFEQGWRRNLKKALANGFEIGLTDRQEDLDTFIALNRRMLARKHFLDSGNVLTTPQLIRDMPAALKPKIVLARHQGKPVVGAAIVFAGDTAHYLFGASDDSMLPLKGGYALQWWLIDWLRREGFKWYDLGGESLSDGLRQFKRGLVGKQGCVLEGNIEYECDGSIGGRMAAEVIFAVRSAKRAYMKYLNR
ncbi:MAG: lipid II:glycine glycyltransferase FemX [Pseudolabrys sp.]